MRLLLLGLLISGCVTVYQPVSAYQRPVIVDPSAPNFDGMRIRVRCIPSGDGADEGEMNDLCENMSALYTNQGARVETEVPEEGGANGPREGADQEDETPRQGQKVIPPGKPDLIIELRARRVHSENSPLLWALCYASATLIPAITEATFAQDVSIQDGDGFLLLQDTLTARFIRYFGFGYWAIQGLIDLIVRPKGEGLIGNNHKTDFSRDFHGQMSQLAFHAVMREKILRSFEPDAASSAAPVPAEQAPGSPKGPKQRVAPPQRPQESQPGEWAPPPPPPSAP